MRLIDIIIAIVSLTLFLPILLIIPILIKLDDRGPIFFCQERLGIDQTKITVWKFRTMKNQQITRVGKWLRACALDEFLQFFLILTGKISLVGPRPLTESDVKRLDWVSDEYKSRWQVRPGLTGLVQIYGGTSAKHSWSLEKHYVTQKSFLLDLKIIFLSAIITIIGKKRTKKLFPFQP